MELKNQYIKTAAKTASNAAFVFLPRNGETPSISELSYCATKFCRYLHQDIAMRLTGNEVDAFQLQFECAGRFVRAFVKEANKEAERIGARVRFDDVTLPGGAIKLQAQFVDEQ